MRYLTRRIGLFLVTLWAALTVNFIIPRVMPGNEAQAVLGTFHRRLCRLGPTASGALGEGYQQDGIGHGHADSHDRTHE